MECSRRDFIGAVSGTLATTAMAPRGAAADEDDPLGVRRDFPVTGDTVFLNSAYIAPVPMQVVEAGRAFLEAKARRPISLGDAAGLLGQPYRLCCHAGCLRRPGLIHPRVS